MKFFHKYIQYFYSSFLLLGLFLYLVGETTKLALLIIMAMSLGILGLAIFCYDNWRKVASIYFTYVYVSPKEKYEQKLKCEEDPNYLQELQMDRVYKKSFYLKSLLRAIFLGLCSFGILIVLAVGTIKLFF